MSIGITAALLVVATVVVSAVARARWLGMVRDIWRSRGEYGRRRNRRG